MAANAPRVPRLDVLLSEFSANGCFRVCAAAISGFGLRDWNLGLPSRAAPTYHTASNYQTRATSDEDRPTWADAGPDRRSNNY